MSIKIEMRQSTKRDSSVWMAFALCINIVCIWLAIYLFISYIVPICRLWHANGPAVACDVKFKVARHFAPQHKSLDCNLCPPNWNWIRSDIDLNSSSSAKDFRLPVRYRVSPLSIAFSEEKWRIVFSYRQSRKWNRKIKKWSEIIPAIQRRTMNANANRDA